MPRYYCDYCDTYLTHDSPSVRKQHNAGYKHKANVRSYYQQFEEQQTQSFIDQKVKEHLGQTGYQQVGAAFHQHLTVMQAGQYRPPIALPVLQPPTLAVPGSVPGAIRPPVLPRPPLSSPAYGAPPGVSRPQPGVDANGILRHMPPTLTPPGAPGVRPPMSFPTASPNPAMPSGSTGTPLSNGLYANFAPASGASTASYMPQGALSSASDSQYSSQQAFRPMAPPGSSGPSYGRGPSSMSNNYSSATPGSIANYGS